LAALPSRSRAGYEPAHEVSWLADQDTRQAAMDAAIDSVVDRGIQALGGCPVAADHQ
jgi:hypothetical protein